MTCVIVILQTLELVYKALEHPHGREILGAAVQLLSVDMLVKGSPVEPIRTEVTQQPTDEGLPHRLELESKGVDTSSSGLLQVAKENPVRLQTAINAWLRWASNILLKYPTDSLIKAIRENWQ